MTDENDYDPDADEHRQELITQNVIPLPEVEDAPFESFAIKCAGCGATFCQIGAPKVTGYEAVCSECGVPSFFDSALAVADHYAHWRRDDDSAPEIGALGIRASHPTTSATALPRTGRRSFAAGSRWKSAGTVRDEDGRCYGDVGQRV